MLLSELVYYCVKNVIYLGDSSFNYQSFLQGDFDNDIDYAVNINNAFTPINEAISRLNDLNRIPFIVDSVLAENREIEFSKLSKQAKEIVGVYQNGQSISYKVMGKKIVLTGQYSSSNGVFVEYKENIKFFTSEDLVQLEEEEGVIVDNNIDLYEVYGIDNSMAQYIIEYAEGRLLEPIAPELSNLHITRAETYFANLDTVKKASHQTQVTNKYKIGW